MEIPQPRDLGRGRAQGVENREGQRVSPQIRVQLVELAQHPLVLERIRHVLAAAALQLGAPHRRHVEREVGDHREDHPAIHAAVPPLRHHRRQILAVRMVSVEIKE